MGGERERRVLRVCALPFPVASCKDTPRKPAHCCNRHAGGVPGGDGRHACGHRRACRHPDSGLRVQTCRTRRHHARRATPTCHCAVRRGAHARRGMRWRSCVVAAVQGLLLALFMRGCCAGGGSSAAARSRGRSRKRMRALAELQPVDAHPTRSPARACPPPHALMSGCGDHGACIRLPRPTPWRWLPLSSGQGWRCCSSSSPTAMALSRPCTGASRVRAWRQLAGEGANQL